MKLSRLIPVVIIALLLLFSVCPVVIQADDGQESGTTITGTVPLVTSDVSASNIGYYSATISWKTDGNSTSQVFYDTVSRANIADYAYHTGEDTTLVSVHSITLTGLSSSTTYHYRVRSAIPGTEFIAISADYTFTAAAPPAGGGGWGGGAPALPPGTTDVRGIVTTAGRFTRSVAATSEDRLCTFTIPAGTVGLTKELEPLTQISLTTMTTPPAPPAEANVIGLVYDLGLAGATFDPPITLTFTYDPANIPAGVAEENLVIAFWDGSKWVELTNIKVDPVTHNISGETSHFTAFSVIAYTRPAAFTVSALTLSPTEVKPGESVSIAVTVTNTGDLSGTYDVTLKINNVAMETKKVTLSGQSSQKLTFTTTRDAAGSYSVSVDSLSGSFTVKAAPAPPPPPALATFSASNLSIQPLEVQPKEQVTITVSAANTGGTEGSYSVVLKINGVKEAEKSVTIAPGKSQSVSFSVTKEEVGSYNITVDGLSGSFTVVAPSPVKPPMNWPLIGGIIAAVVVVGLLGFFLIRRRAH